MSYRMLARLEPVTEPATRRSCSDSGFRLAIPSHSCRRCQRIFRERSRKVVVRTFVFGGAGPVLCLFTVVLEATEEPHCVDGLVQRMKSV